MLVLTRAIGEALIIGEHEIHLSVLEVRGNQVRLGIEAPREISIHREEVLRRRQLEAKRAAAMQTEAAEA